MRGVFYGYMVCLCVSSDFQAYAKASAGFPYIFIKLRKKYVYFVSDLFKKRGYFL